MRSFTRWRGVSLVDVVVGSALFLIIFVALFGVLRASIAVSGLAKVKATATAIATSQIEYIRSLDYSAVGTVAGIPSGTIAQQTTVTEAGLDFSLRTFIVYVDDSADGTGVSDSNGITTDYKRIKVTVSYTINEIVHEVVLLTNAVPSGIESNAGGGTIRINVVDALGAPVSGATVRVLNASVSPTVDVTTFSDSTGAVLFGGAPASTDYEVYVSKSGYSSEQTYERDTTNVNPTPGYLTVAQSQTTTSTFAIDILSTLTVGTFAPIQPGVTTDTFNDTNALASFANTVVSGGELHLASDSSGYISFGTAESTDIAPTYLASWTSASSTTVTPAGTGAVLQVMDGTGTLLPEGVLPGNSSGFTGTINLSGISTTTYPALRLHAELSTGDPLATASVLDWELGYDEGPLPIADVPVTITGAKTIGSTTGGLSIFKTVISTTTDALGIRVLTVEWDSYDIEVGGYTVVAPNPFVPYEVLPNATVDATLILTP